MILTAPGATHQAHHMLSEENADGTVTTTPLGTCAPAAWQQAQVRLQGLRESGFTVLACPDRPAAWVAVQTDPSKSFEAVKLALISEWVGVRN